jgi:hypothetical protein
MAKHAESVAALIKKLDAAPADTRPLRTLDFPIPKLDLISAEPQRPTGSDTLPENQGGGGPGGQ